MFPAITPGDKVQIWVDGDMVYQTEAQELILQLEEGEFIKAGGKVYVVQNVSYDEEYDVVEIDCTEIIPEYEF